MANSAYTQEIAKRSTTVKQLEKLASLILSRIGEIPSIGKDSIKTIQLVNGNLEFYTAEGIENAEPNFFLNLPTEYFLDQAKTEFIPKFKFADGNYPEDTDDPELEGKPVIVMAVKGSDYEDATYSFIDLSSIGGEEKADLLANATEGNIAILDKDGNYKDSGISMYNHHEFLRYAGSVTFESLSPEIYLVPEHVGDVYHITNTFTSNKNFIDGGGNEYLEGIDIAIIKDNTGAIKFDALDSPEKRCATDEEFDIMLEHIGLLDKSEKLEHKGIYTATAENKLFYLPFQRTPEEDLTNNFVWKNHGGKITHECFNEQTEKNAIRFKPGTYLITDKHFNLTSREKLGICFSINYCAGEYDYNSAFFSMWNDDMTNYFAVRPNPFFRGTNNATFSFEMDGKNISYISSNLIYGHDGGHGFYQNCGNPGTWTNWSLQSEVHQKPETGRNNYSIQVNAKFSGGGNDNIGFGDLCISGETMEWSFDHIAFNYNPFHPEASNDIYFENVWVEVK